MFDGLANAVCNRLLGIWDGCFAIIDSGGDCYAKNPPTTNTHTHTCTNDYCMILSSSRGGGFDK